MSLRNRLAKLLLFAIIEFGALLGVPMTPKQIEKVMNLMNRPAVVKKQESSDD